MNTPPSPACDLPHSLGALIGMVRSEIVRAIETDLTAQGADLKFTQFHVLKQLAYFGHMTATELARAVDVDGGAMTRQLDQLEAKGYLRRQPHEQDRRALRIELTEAGQLLWKHLHESNMATLERAQKGLTEVERANLLDYLERVLSALREKN